MPGGVRELPLTKGLVALVDGADFTEVSQYKWCATFCDGRHYAIRRPPSADGPRRMLTLHRHLMLPPPGFMVDHIDGDGLNNTRANLRLCDRFQNAWNSRRRPSRTGFRGVAEKEPGVFRAMIKARRVVYYGRCTRSPVEAARDYDALARQLHGEFATLNFPESA